MKKLAKFIDRNDWKIDLVQMVSISLGMGIAWKNPDWNLWGIIGAILFGGGFISWIFCVAMVTYLHTSEEKEKKSNIMVVKFDKEEEE